MAKDRLERYIENFQKLIRIETVSDPDCGSSPENFELFRRTLWEMYPDIRSACEYWDFDGAMLLKWKGKDSGKLPVLFMNHYDVVPAAAEDWKYPPFSGEVAEGKLWGRGAIDDKSGLWAMLEAANELASEGFVPERDIWFECDNTEETLGNGAQAVVSWLKEQGISFEMVFDEGGDIVNEPMEGVKANIALIGVGEKSIVNLKFTARSAGGHASTPGKDTPIVRLGRFLAYVEWHSVFDVKMPPAITEMLKTFAPYMGKAGNVLAKADRMDKPLARLMPLFGSTAAAFVSTTIAFTMQGGGEAINVIPSEAWVKADMRCSHHQGKESSIKAITKAAKKFDVETEVLESDPESRLADHNGEAFRLAAEATMACVPGVDACAPYIMTGASDSRFFDELSDQCIRYLPFCISGDQLDSVHGVNEYMSLDSLVPAVDYFRYMMQHV